jgi:hypothetical protein
MYYVTHISHWMQKHMFGVTCPGVLFMKTALGPAEHEKWCIDVSRPRRIGIHNVTSRPHQMKNTSFA